MNCDFRKHGWILQSEAMIYCYITVDGILCLQFIIGFIFCRMPSHFMYFVGNDEIKMFNMLKQGMTLTLAAQHDTITSAAYKRH